MSSAGRINMFPGAFDDRRRRGYFLHQCFLCKKRIPKNRDIFMYRGDAPFCSEECRQEQIDMDEALEVDRALSRANVPLNHSSSSQSSSSSSSVKRKATVVFSSEARFDAGTAAVLAG